MSGIAMFLGGLLGSSHCLGMCGGFALLLYSKETSRGRNLTAQLAYSLGRIFTYATLGLLAGHLGQRLTQLPSIWIPTQKALSIGIGFSLIGVALFRLGFVRIRLPKLGLSNCTGLGEVFRSHLGPGRFGKIFVGGVLNGFLPCGLVYSFFALALTHAEPWHGMLGMTAFGLGTLPAMISLSLGFSFLTPNGARRVFRLSALFFLGIGILTVVRGFSTDPCGCAALTRLEPPSTARTWTKGEFLSRPASSSPKTN